MTDETQTTETNTDLATKGLPEGVTPDNLSEGQGRTAGAPKLPEITKAPEKVEEKPADEHKELTPAEQAAKDEADKKAEEEAKKTEEVETEETEYPVYDDPSADAVVQTLKAAGVSVKESAEWFKVAVAENDISKIDTKAMTEKLGKTQADLVMAGIKTYFEREMGSVKAKVSAAHESVGGEANWKLLADWSAKQRELSPEYAKRADELNQMLDLNPTAAKYAAQELRSLYEADPKNGSLTVTKVDGNKAASSVQVVPNTSTRAEYLAEITKAEMSGDHAKAAALRASRAAQIKRN